MGYWNHPGNGQSLGRRCARGAKGWLLHFTKTTSVEPIVSIPLVAGAGVVGGRLASKAAEEACSHGPEFKQKNDLYFLLRLTNEAD